MRTVRLVHKAQHIMLMRQLHDAAQIRADTIIGRIVHEHGSRLRISLDSLLHLANFHAQRDSQLAVDLRININRNSTVQNECVDNTLMHITRQNNLVASLAG